MKTIHKYKVNEDTISIPLGFKILDLQVQRGIPCLWVLVDKSANSVDMQFEIYGTGWEMPDDPGKYVGTYQESESFVYHVFMKESE